MANAEYWMIDNPSLLFEDQAAWSRWLEQHHADSPGVWLQISKKNSDIRSVSYAEALEEALCYGWIDGQKKTGPDGVWLQRFTPRRDRSIWSKVNRAKALALIEAGRMHPAGTAAIVRAKSNGQWDAAYGAFSTAEIPEDLAKELQTKKSAKAFFEQLSAQNRYAILFRLQTAKKPETRAKRLAKFVDMLTRGETIHPQ
jgi:uncharacterized protein YdeI (YjbR/CyaY-like superfamily)